MVEKEGDGYYPLDRNWDREAAGKTRKRQAEKPGEKLGEKQREREKHALFRF